MNKIMDNIKNILLTILVVAGFIICIVIEVCPTTDLRQDSKAKKLEARIVVLEKIHNIEKE